MKEKWVLHTITKWAFKYELLTIFLCRLNSLQNHLILSMVFFGGLHGIFSQIIRYSVFHSVVIDGVKVYDV